MSQGKGKGKVNHASQESVGQCGYLLSRKASLPVGWYQIILLIDVYVNNLSWVALDSGEARIRTRDLLITSPAF